MAGGMDWFRWHHGTVSDPKFQLIARKANARVSDVLAVWATVLEAASQSDERGNHGDLDHESIDLSLGLDDGMSEVICSEMRTRGLLDEHGEILAWQRRQVKRERDDSSTERVRKHRDRQRQKDPSNANETPGNATQHQETPRGEERREEDIDPNGSCDPQADLLCSQETESSNRMDYEEVRAAFQKHCKELAQPKHSSNWTDARKKKVRTLCKRSKKYSPTEFYERYFEFVAQNDFLMGRKDGKWRADFDWLLNGEKFQKISEGGYDNGNEERDYA